MNHINSYFTDFESYKESVVDWELDFRLLSKNDFSSYLNMYISDNIQITRTILTGKLEQYGLTPLGFTSLTIPVNYDKEFIWLNKKTKGDKILVFPKCRTLDAVSYDNFDVYVLSIRDSYLYELIEQNELIRAAKLFNGDEQHIPISRIFSLRMNILLDNILSSLSNNVTVVSTSTISVLGLLLNEINNRGALYQNAKLRKRDIAITTAVKYINENIEEQISIPELCSLVDVSERTLEYAFFEKYKISPNQYIKYSRLNMVKQDLYKSRKTGTKISTIAGKYNFWHMGQFAHDFKLQFGKLPSEIRK